MSKFIIETGYKTFQQKFISWSQRNLGNVALIHIMIKIMAKVFKINQKICSKNTKCFKIGKKDSLSYVFYKTDFSKNFSVEDFSLVETTGC